MDRWMDIGMDVWMDGCRDRRVDGMSYSYLCMELAILTHITYHLFYDDDDDNE